MVLTALRGALGFLTRFPIGRNEAAWTAFKTTPAAFPLAGYLVGAVLALPMLLRPLGSGTAVAAVGVVWVYAVTGITHLDGVADLGDAAVVHGDADRRREVLADAALGVGGTAALGLVLLALGLAFLGLAGLPLGAAAAVVVAAEVGAKLSMAGLAALGEAPHEGLGSAFTESAGPRALAPAVLVALPVALLAWPTPASAAALVGAGSGGALLGWWGSGLLGGSNGDVFGAANEAARVAGLHAGVVAWTLF